MRGRGRVIPRAMEGRAGPEAEEGGRCDGESSVEGQGGGRHSPGRPAERQIRVVAEGEGAGSDCRGTEEKKGPDLVPDCWWVVRKRKEEGEKGLPVQLPGL